MWRLSWAITLSFSLAMLTGILIVTRDLSTTNSIFKDGVVQANQVNATTGKALKGAAHLPPADTAIGGSLPQVAGVLNSLSTAEVTLGSLSTQLGSLGSALASADTPLVAIIGAATSATGSANDAARSASDIVKTLSEASAKLKSLAAELHQTDTSAKTIESKLRILLLFPTLGS